MSIMMNVEYHYDMMTMISSVMELVIIFMYVLTLLYLQEWSRLR